MKGFAIVKKLSLIITKNEFGINQMIACLLIVSLLQYDDLDALEADFTLLCKNAQAYNEDSSLIFEDSIVLQSVFTNAREKLKGEWENEPDEPEEDATPAGSTTGALDEDAPVVVDLGGASGE